MKYIVYKKVNNILFGPSYERSEMNTNEELKTYLFNNKNNLSSIEVFDEKGKVEIIVDINIKNTI